MRLTARLLLGLAIVCLAVAGLRADEAQLPEASDKTVEYERDVLPILSKHCARCHGSEKQESSLRVDSRESLLAGGDLGEPTVVVGKSGDSPLIQYVSGADPSLQMPPKGKGEALTASQVAILRGWIDQGLKFPAGGSASARPTTSHWSFQPVKRPEIPKTTGAARTPIDAFLLAKLEAHGLNYAARADRVTLIRRATLDLLGLPPTPEEVSEFVNDTRPDAWPRLVDRLLASPHYGERFARDWLDLVRFAESNGFEMNQERPNAWRYRDYVVSAYNRDLPFDQFVREQLAGDSLKADIATGFLVAGAWDQVKSPDPALTAMQRQDELHDIVATTGTVFLGLTVGCARCHSHKFDPISQKDYYAFQGIFAGVQHGERGVSRGQSPERERRIAALRQLIADADTRIGEYTVPADAPQIVWMDDELPEQESGPSVQILAPIAGHGANPEGTSPGEKLDAGDVHRLPNVSQGKYTWWRGTAGQPVMAYRPRWEGTYRLWLSWGAGYVAHTRQAEYLLDLDGNLETTSDQQLIATVDQQRGANISQPLPEKPLWSGFQEGGVIALNANSAIVLRAAVGGEPITADIIALEPVQRESQQSVLLPAARPAVSPTRNIERFAPRAARFIRMTITGTNGAAPCLDELEAWSVATGEQPAQNVALQAPGVKLTSSGDYPNAEIHKLEHLNDGRYGNSRSWISNTDGRGWVQIELPESRVIDRIEWGRDRERKFTDRLATEYIIEVADKPGEWEVVATAANRLPAGSPGTETVWLSSAPSAELPALRELLASRQQASAELAELTAPMMAYAGVFNKDPGPTHKLYRGDPLAPREPVIPDALEVMTSLGLRADTPENDRRLKFAQWVTSADNPLTARVAVNRIWQHHFGTGIVDTPSDFGANGTKPSHPELLDWLASEFVAQGWSLKSLHRLILLSDAYQQSAAPSAKGLASDAQARLLWRYPTRRLEAEVIRDSILTVTGELNLAAGGPGWSAFEPNTNYVRVYKPKETFAPSDLRRGIYMTKVRMRADGVFGVFDVPDGGQTCPKRTRSTTAIQSLNLFNSRFMMQQAKAFAERLEQDAGNDLAAQIGRAFDLAFSRQPTPEELQESLSFANGHGREAFCRALLNANELVFIP